MFAARRSPGHFAVRWFVLALEGACIKTVRTNALSNRNSQIKLLIVATDGMENSSTIFTNKTQIFNLAKEKNIPVIILGALFSDLNFMRELASETNGIYIYNKSFLKLKNEINTLIQLLANIQAIEITNIDWQDVSEFEIITNNVTLSFDFND